MTGSASGIGRAVAERLTANGDRVIGIDRADADVVANLATTEGRALAIAEVLNRTGGAIDRVVAAAGVSGVGTDAATTVSVNYFGSVEMLDGLRPAMEGRNNACAVGVVSNSAVFGIEPDDLAVAAMLAGDEAAARSRHEGIGTPNRYRLSAFRRTSSMAYLLTTSSWPNRSRMRPTDTALTCSTWNAVGSSKPLRTSGSATTCRGTLRTVEVPGTTITIFKFGWCSRPSETISAGRRSACSGSSGLAPKSTDHMSPRTSCDSNPIQTIR